jgi:hypothetical protein
MKQLVLHAEENSARNSNAPADVRERWIWFNVHMDIWDERSVRFLSGVVERLRCFAQAADVRAVHQT